MQDKLLATIVPSLQMNRYVVNLWHLLHQMLSRLPTVGAKWKNCFSNHTSQNELLYLETGIFISANSSAPTCPTSSSTSPFWT